MQSNICTAIDETSSFSSSFSLAEVRISKTTANKRKPMLAVNAYDFQMKNYNKAKTIKFWRCAHRNCSALLHANLNEEFVRFSRNIADHSHLQNPATLEIRTLREKMRQLAEHEVRKDLLAGETLATLPNILNL
ncbi:unnamed protein product, partial [Rotaria magnacalcarata]